MKTKLIIVEGLPGSGKTTTAQIVDELLTSKGVETRLFLEGNLEHPADYDGVSFLTCNQYSTLLEDFPKYKNIIEQMAVKDDGGYFLYYRKTGIDIEQKLHNDILKYDIYELPIDLHLKLIKQKWKDFVTEYQNKDCVVIFECCFIQNPVTVTMVRDNAPYEITVKYIESLSNIIAPLDPILIYVSQRDISSSFTHVIDERPQGWYNSFINYYTKQGYGLEHGLIGLEGTIQILKARGNLEYQIYNHLSINKFIIDNSHLNYATYKEALRKKLSSIIKI